jgi:transposase-like protein
MSKKIAPETKLRVLELHEEGLSYTKISKELGISRSTAHEIVKETVASQTRPETPEIEQPISTSTAIEVEAASETAESIPPLEDLVLVPPVAKPKRQGRGRPPMAESGEVKRATTIAILPSVYEATRKICYVQRHTISDLVNSFLEKFVAENQEDLKKY